MSTTPTSPSSARAPLVAVLAFLFSIFVLVACQRCAGPAVTPGASPLGSSSAAAQPDELQQLAQVLDQAETVLNLSSVACMWSTDPERCFDTLGALEDAVAVGRALLSSAETCRTASAQGCLADAVATARSKLPELRRLTTVAESLQPRRLAPDDPLVMGAAGGAGAADAAGAGGSR